MNRFKCPACGGNQYTSADTAQECIYCGNKELKKMKTLEQEDEEDEDWRNLGCRSRILPSLSTSSSAGTVGSTGGAGSR
jgi:DNA-directed RNA polymerase subunit RPC12/RpoP